MIAASDPAHLLLAACMALIMAGAAIQAAVGAGLSVVSGFFLLLWLGTATGVPTLLCLNLVVSITATALGGTSMRWGDVALASEATLAGCLLASVLPALPDPILRAMTACILLAVALPRPPVPEALPSERSTRAGIALAALVAGALTVWTATPGPITPVAMARGGRSGTDIQRTMQPVSVIGYGAALAWSGLPRINTIGVDVLGGLIASTLVGTTAGLLLRPKINPARVVLLLRVVAGTAAALLLLSLFR